MIFATKSLKNRHWGTQPKKTRFFIDFLSFWGPFLTTKIDSKSTVFPQRSPGGPKEAPRRPQRAMLGQFGVNVCPHRVIWGQIWVDFGEILSRFNRHMGEGVLATSKFCHPLRRFAHCRCWCLLSLAFACFRLFSLAFACSRSLSFTFTYFRFLFSRFRLLSLMRFPFPR